MLSQRRIMIARSVGEAVAHSHFIMMLNPRYRGKRFVWDSLYEIVDRFARTHVGLAGPFGRDQKAMERIAAIHAKFALDRCFEESGVKDWLVINERQKEPVSLEGNCDLCVEKFTDVATTEKK